MREEKMMILTMLEEGKITAEEAIKLLEALEDIDVPNSFSKNDELKNENPKKETSPGPLIFDTLGEIGSDIGNALSSVFDGLRDFTQSIGFWTNYETVSKVIDYDLEHENPSLDLSGINGSIKLRPIEGNKLKISAVCQYKKGLLLENENFFNFTAAEGRIVFSPKYNSTISVKLDVSLPDKKYNEILLNTSNGKIDIKELDVNSLICITSNSAIELADVNARKVDLTTKNGRIECRDINTKTLKAGTTNSGIYLNDISCSEIDAKTANAKIDINDIVADKIACRTSNASIDAVDIACQTLSLITSNGKVVCEDLDLNRIKEIRIITSNGSISSKICEMERPIYLDLETSMGNINLEIPNLVYKVNKQVKLGQKKIIAHSPNYNENTDHLRFTASTSNGSIKIYEG